jgi:Co/Zn/Cd efflux system component
MELRAAKDLGRPLNSGLESNDSAVQEEDKVSNPGAFRRYSRVIYVNIFFMVLELVGGKLSNSFAVISEGSLLIIDIFTSITRIFGAYSLEKSKCRLTQRSTPTSTLATCGWRRWPWSSRSP